MKTPPSVVSEIAFEAIKKTLANSSSAWWEIDGALMALGKCKGSDIRSLKSLVLKYSKHPDWYVRESTFHAILGLAEDMTSDEFMALAKMYRDSKRVFVRKSFNDGFSRLFRNRAFDRKIVTKEALTLIGSVAHSPNLMEGYLEDGAKGEAAHRTMVVLKNMDAKYFKLLLPELLTYLSGWDPYSQGSVWLITGSKWQPGMIKIMKDLGKDGKPIRDALATIVKNYGSFDKKRIDRIAKGLSEKMEAAIQEWDKRYR